MNSVKTSTAINTTDITIGDINNCSATWCGTDNYNEDLIGVFSTSMLRMITPVLGVEVSLRVLLQAPVHQLISNDPSINKRLVVAFEGVRDSDVVSLGGYSADRKLYNKIVNDTYWHNYGDYFVIAISREGFTEVLKAEINGEFLELTHIS